jgi:hypothetical protein
MARRVGEPAQRVSKGSDALSRLDAAEFDPTIVDPTVR